MATSTPPGLLSPLRVRSLRLRNRIAMPPMANNRATETGQVTPAIIEHYMAHAAGLGLIIVEHSYVRPRGRVHALQLGIHSDATLPGLTDLVAALADCGVPAVIQITHAGGRTTREAAGGQPEGPSPIAPPRAAEVPRELDGDDLGVLAADFAAAARRAQRAGFAAVELHGAHGYLLNQFYSPLTNQRHDAYGGNRDDRLRFPLEVVTAVRDAVGPDYPIFYRLGADDMLPGGLTVDDAVYAAPALAAAGVDCIDISGGLGGSQGPGPDREGYFDYLSAPVRRVAGVPVLVTGGVRTAAGADRLVRTGVADLVGVGRALLADPRWAAKARVELGGGPA